MEVKTIDVRAKEWRDKVCGNSYFSACIILNYGMTDEKEFRIPFQYGYGNFYEQAALSLLIEKGILGKEEFDNLWQVRGKGIILRSNIERGCLQRDVKNYGKEE